MHAMPATPSLARFSPRSALARRRVRFRWLRQFIESNAVMNAFAQHRPFAGFIAALARAFAGAWPAPRPAEADPHCFEDERIAADVGFGPGDCEPRPRRGVDPGPAPFAAPPAIWQ